MDPRTEARPQIPTDSMADIAFLLIVFFMLTVTFAGSRGLDFRLPPDEQATVVEPLHSIHVLVRPDGSLAVDRQPMALENLVEYLRPRLERAPSKPVILETSPTAPYGAMVRVYDELRRAGAELGLADGLVVAVPTRREITSFWS